jgi:hypothetical protein
MTANEKTFSADEWPMPTEVYSRVVGYLRPIDSWNEAKRLEFEERKTYKVNDEIPVAEETTEKHG